MEKKLTIDVEALKKSLLQRRPMKARFKLPMSEDEAYAYLLAAMMAEVEYRHRSFCTSEDMENQLHEIAYWLTSSSPKFGMLLCWWLWQWQEHHAQSIPTATKQSAYSKIVQRWHIRNPDSGCKVHCIPVQEQL